MVTSAAEHDPAAPPRGVAEAPVRGGRALLLVSILLPALLLGLASWRNRIDVMREADLRVERTLRVLHEHAVKVFETQKLMLDRINERLRTLDWQREADRSELHRYLKALQDDYDQVAAISVTDARGSLIASSRQYPADTGLLLADREWFDALRRPDSRAVYVSRSYTGRLSGRPVFAVATRSDSRDATFTGAIAISVERAYFEAFYRAIDPDLPHSVTLIRSDGSLLARDPATPVERLPNGGALLQAIEREEGPALRVSPVDGVARILAFRRLANYPVYIGFGLDEAVVLRTWWSNVASFALVAGLAALALLCVSALAIRQTRQERRATQAWHAAADALAAEAVERRRAEAQLRQAQKMEAVGRLTGGVAHDFNNLLTVVIGNLEMAQRRVAEADHRLGHRIACAMDGARRAATLTHRLLAFSRQSPLAPEAVDPNRLVIGMSDLFRHTLGEGIAVETILTPDLWWARADANQVESALLNLAVNARDAMPEGGRITVETGNSYLDADDCAAHDELRPGQYAMIAVSDTGTGMSPEVRAQAFEPFFTTKPAGKGSGLGLAQVYGFMRQSGGHAEIASGPEGGTTVRLYFPRLTRVETGRTGAESPEVPTLIPGHLDRAPRPGLTVLCVEDDPMVRAFSVAALEEAGYRTLQAATGAEALTCLEAWPDTDLLFTDVVLGGAFDGRRLAEAALTRRPGLKVLFTTGHARGGSLPLADGANLLGKPFTAAQLGRKVRAVLAAG